ncbi:MAG TPA: heme-dependent oxidative N-demethylase subunit alpha family protein, partial [Caldimonas sp.]|nr:heme-dependent oxidative N-demethylase subunit alpha family protein [Caldimonas sp.]
MGSFDFSLVSAPFRIQPGLRRVAPGAAQLTPSAPGGRHLREKIAVLGSFANQAMLSTPAVDEPALLHAVAAEAARSCPGAFVAATTAEGRTIVAAPRLGWTLDDGTPGGDGDASIGAVLAALPPAQRPSALLAFAFEEDFALIDGASATLPWLAVCLPSRWAPEEKIGRHFAEVHAPVADNETLLAASASLARLVTGDDRWERFVWTITADPRLHQHPARGAPDWPSQIDADAEGVAANAFFRSERQTFIPIAGRRQAIFTIHVESAPLADAVASADAARRLHDAIASMSAPVLAYRRLAG